MGVEHRFWRSPVLVAQLIPFLDVASTLALTSAQPLVFSLLQRRFMWKDLIRRSKIGEDHAYDDEDKDSKKIVVQLVSILKMMEDPKPLLLDLLDHICHRYQDTDPMRHRVLLSCSLHPTDHKVEPRGFQLLELAEGAFGTALQTVKELEYQWSFNENQKDDLDYAQALTERIARQKTPLRRVEMITILLLSNTGITATLLQNAEEWEIEQIYLQRDFGEEGWSWLAEGLRRARTGSVRLENIWLSKDVMGRAKREDLKAVWEATHGTWWMQEHSQDPLPKDTEEWDDWRNRFSQMPSAEDDILWGGFVMDDDEEDDNGDEEEEEEGEEEEEDDDEDWKKIEEILGRVLE